MLRIGVRGDAGIENYRVVWDGLLMQSYPIQARIVVVYDTPKAASDSMQHDYTLELNLQELFGSTVRASDVSVHVSNGSK